jgi:hypothetical protein
VAIPLVVIPPAAPPVIAPVIVPPVMALLGGEALELLQPIASNQATQ